MTQFRLMKKAGTERATMILFCGEKEPLQIEMERLKSKCQNDAVKYYIVKKG